MGLFMYIARSVDLIEAKIIAFAFHTSYYLFLVYNAARFGNWFLNKLNQDHNSYRKSFVVPFLVLAIIIMGTVFLGFISSLYVTVIELRNNRTQLISPEIEIKTAELEQASSGSEGATTRVLSD